MLRCEEIMFCYIRIFLSLFIEDFWEDFSLCNLKVSLRTLCFRSVCSREDMIKLRAVLCS
jgi:hypothetical protein